MPGKPRHKKGRRPQQGARGRAAPAQPAAVTAEASEMVQVPAAPARPRAAGPQAGTTSASTTPILAPPYIGRELRTIVVLGAIIVIALVVASSLLR